MTPKTVHEVIEAARDSAHDAIHDAVERMDLCAFVQGHVDEALRALKDSIPDARILQPGEVVVPEHNIDAVEAMRRRLGAYESALAATNENGQEESDLELLDKTRRELLDAMRPLLAASQNAAAGSGGHCSVASDSQESPGAGHCQPAAPEADAQEGQ